MTNNIKKTSRLIYVILLCIISYTLLIGSHSPNYSLIGDPINHSLRDSLTNHFFIACYKKKYRKNIFKKECFAKKTTLQIKGQLVHIKNYWRDPQQSKALKEFNNDANRKYTWKYHNDSDKAHYKSNKLTPKIMWALFFLTLPFIWFSRNFSLFIVNITMSIFKKGWKKI